MSTNNGYNGAHVMVAFLVGAVSGACIALLSAPQSGSQTRDQLRGWAKDAQGHAGKVPDALRNAYSRATTAAKEAFTEALQQRPMETDAPEA